MKQFVSVDDIPVGYVVPPFPSLHWPINNQKYKVSFLYYTYDIWRFTVLWTMIFYLAFYMGAGFLAWFNQRHTLKMYGLLIVLLYILVAAFQALVSGSLVGLLLAAVYKAGLFSMSTWIPMSWGAVQILYVVFSSYSMLSVIL